MSGVVSGGPLDPGNPPAPTDGLRRPGTPISELPYAIDEPGLYYLTRDLSATTGQSIVITASNVTLDLGGFSIEGLGMTQAGNGIELADTADYAVIVNGRVTKFVTAVNTASSSLHGRIADLTVHSNLNNGLSLGGHWQVDRCTAVNNGNHGIALASGGTVRNCELVNNGRSGVQATGNNFLIEHNRVVGNCDVVGCASATYAGINIVGNNSTVSHNETAQNYNVDIRLAGTDNILRGNGFCTISATSGNHLVDENVIRGTC